MKQLIGIHHVTAITSSAERIYEFFTYTLGLRLVKKTVNQDDIDTYHLFFADDRGNPGTDVTFFDFQGISKAVRGADEISRIGLRVKDEASLAYWEKRFTRLNVKHEGIRKLFDRSTLFFEDFDGQRYALFSDQGLDGVPGGEPWHKGPIPDQYAIYGLGPIFLEVSDYQAMDGILANLYGMRHVSTDGEYELYEMGAGGNGASVIVKKSDANHGAIQGYGGVHHVAFRIEDKETLDEWTRIYASRRVPNSGFVDRFYFKSLYARPYRPILFELATEGPGFIDDEESYEILGETLALPPRFRGSRARVEAHVRPIDTKRSHLNIPKEEE